MGIRVHIHNITNGIAELELAHVYLQPAADGFELRLGGKILPRAGAISHDVSFKTLDAQVAIEINGGRRLLCEANGDNAAVHWVPQNGEGNFGFSGLVSGAALEAIEEARKGGSLVLYILLRGLLEVRKGTEQVTHGLYLISASPERAELPRSEWENALESCGYGKLIRFALNLNQAQHSQAAIDAYRYLDSAQKVLRHSEFRSAIENSRKALGRLREEEGLGMTDNELFEKAAKKRNELSEPERESLVRAALQVLAQSSVHDGEISQVIEPSYGKATAMVYMTGLVAQMAEQRRKAALLKGGGVA